MRHMRHHGTILRPTKATDDHGQPQGQPEVVMRNVPFSMEPISGREFERIRQQYSLATHVVELYGDPAKPLTTLDWIQFGTRKLHIGAIDDPKQNGIQLRLLCGEEQ